MNETCQCREKILAWVMEKTPFATGHADSLEQLLDELTWQIKELQARVIGDDKPYVHGCVLHPQDEIL